MRGRKLQPKSENAPPLGQVKMFLLSFSWIILKAVELNFKLNASFGDSSPVIQKGGFRPGIAVPHDRRRSEPLGGSGSMLPREKS